MTDSNDKCRRFFLDDISCFTPSWTAFGLPRTHRNWATPSRIEWLAWRPMHHWADRKIRIRAFYCMLGISLLQYMHRQAKAAWSDLSMEQLIEELQQIRQFILLYPRQGEKGPDRAAYVPLKLTLAQQALAKALKLDELQITHRR